MATAGQKLIITFLEILHGPTVEGSLNQQQLEGLMGKTRRYSNRTHQFSKARPGQSPPDAQRAGENRANLLSELLGQIIRGENLADIEISLLNSEERAGEIYSRRQQRPGPERG